MGWGKLEDDLRQMAFQVDPGGDRIRFIPPAPQTELPHWSGGATLGVIPYENICLNHWFCTPNKLWEYPAAGVPILCSPFPELAAVVETFGVGCLLDDPVTPEAIAAAVASMTEEDVQKKVESCKQFIRKDNWGVYEQNLIGLYKSLL
jgi:glycosyltransferase involved in cell wall biosynthesis